MAQKTLFITKYLLREFQSLQVFPKDSGKGGVGSQELMQLLSFLLLLAPGALSHQSRCLPSDTRLPFIYKSFFIKFLYAAAPTYIAFFNKSPKKVIGRRRYFKNFHKRVFSSISKSKLSSFLTLSLSNPFQSFEEEKTTIISLQQKLLFDVLIHLQFKCTIKSEEVFAFQSFTPLHGNSWHRWLGFRILDIFGSQAGTRTMFCAPLHGLKPPISFIS